jgi:hypothetical protein
MVLLRPGVQRKDGAAVINATDDLVWEVQDQVQRVERKLDWLVAQAGGDPAVIGAVPGEAVPKPVKAA